MLDSEFVPGFRGMALEIMNAWRLLENFSSSAPPKQIQVCQTYYNIYNEENGA